MIQVIQNKKVNGLIDTWKLKKALRVTPQKTGSDGLCCENKKITIALVNNTLPRFLTRELAII